VDADNGGLTESELKNLKAHRLGFRVRIYFDDWEAIASTLDELAVRVKEQPIYWYHGIGQLTQTAHIRA
jgi:hypothetical protein